MSTAMIDLCMVVQDFANGLAAADRRAPRAMNARSGFAFQPGIGPHTEAETVKLVAHEMAIEKPEIYGGRVGLGIPYPNISRQKCDLCIGIAPNWEWVIEVKMLRILGDNGKANDNILMHILSPYPEHRSAVTDCVKLSDSGFTAQKGILIYGYMDTQWPLEPAIEAFEALASAKVDVGPRCSADFHQLMHPVHQNGAVYGWEVVPKRPAKENN